MSNLGSLIAMIGAGAAGYGRGQQMKRENERQDARDAQQAEEYAYQKGERERATKLRTDLAASQQDVQPEVVSNTGATYQNDELLAADNRENRRNMEQTGREAPAPMTPAAYTAGGQTFADKPAAAVGLMGTNSRSAKAQRAADVYGAAGDLENQAKFQAFADHHLAEGADKLLSSVQGDAPSVADVKKAGGIVTGKIGAGAAEAYNKTGGKYTVSGDTTVQHFIDKDAAGREVVNSRIIGPDGKPVVSDVRTAAMMMMDAKTRLEAQQNDTRTYQTGQQISESSRHNTAQERQAAADSARTAAHQAAALGLQRQGLQLQKDAAFAATPAGQIKALELAAGAPLTTDQIAAKLGISKWSEGDKMQLTNLNKRREAMDAAKSKAMTDGTFDPNSPGAKQMAIEAAALDMQMNRVLSKYQTGAAGKLADPLGIMGGGAPAAPAAKPASRPIAPPLAPSNVAPVWQPPSQAAAGMAVTGLQAAMENTGRALAAAQKSGNMAEVNRLLDVFGQQKAALNAAMGTQ